MTETIERALTLGEAMRAPGYVGSEVEAGDLLLILAHELQRLTKLTTATPGEPLDMDCGDSLRKRVADLTTPRPIAEAPKNGTWVQSHWSKERYPKLQSVRWAIARYVPDCRVWVDERQEPLLEPSHFLPLPVLS